MWQENLKNGSLKVETLKTITDNSYNVFGEFQMFDVTPEEIDAKLTNLVAAREAMKQLRESRSGVWGWLWKVIFNRTQNSQEKEYLRDKNLGLDIAVPENYYPNDDDSKAPIVSWRSHANLLFSNWLNYFVYQTPPYDITKIK